MTTKSAGDLGGYLRSLRQAVGMTLRDVEKASKDEVSNAYLSQVESGQARRPAPGILHALARVYQVPYERLMELAGYLTKVTEPNRARNALPTMATGDLSPEDEKKVLDYIAFLRSQRKRK